MRDEGVHGDVAISVKHKLRVNQQLFHERALDMR